MPGQDVNNTMTAQGGMCYISSRCTESVLGSLKREQSPSLQSPRDVERKASPRQRRVNTPFQTDSTCKSPGSAVRTNEREREEGRLEDQEKGRVVEGDERIVKEFGHDLLNCEGP